MGVARKKPTDDEWISAYTAECLAGKSRIWLLTRALAGELEARVMAGRAVIHRPSLEKLIATLPGKSRK